MKKKWIIISAVALTIILAITIFKIFPTSNNTIKLENKYYGSSQMIEIDPEKLGKLIDNKESFVLFVYQNLCITSANFETVLNEFLDEFPITIYKIPFSDLKDSKLASDIKYYPSFAIYHNGEIIDFLDANKDEDSDYYKNKDNFVKWIKKYVNLDNINSNNKVNTSNDSIKDNEANTSKVDLDDISKEEGKVNIYFFWGDGCPHCEAEFAFFDSIEKEYSKYYNLYTFETWKNEDNAELLKTFADAMGVEAKGVPYTIIGDQFFKGFNDTLKNEFIAAIENQSQNDFDVYFDKIVDK